MIIFPLRNRRWAQSINKRKEKRERQTKKQLRRLRCMRKPNNYQCNIRETNQKMPIKSVEIKISKNKKMRFFLISQGSLNPKIRFLGQNVCSVAWLQTDRQTHRHTDTQTHTKVKTEDTLSGFQEFFLQPIIKDRSKICSVPGR